VPLELRLKEIRRKKGKTDRKKGRKKETNKPSEGHSPRPFLFIFIQSFTLTFILS
jgi:hypothetical protein